MITLAIQAVFALGAFGLPPQDPKPRTELPLSPPSGWETKEQDGTIALTPKDLQAGTVYTVLVPGLPRKMGTVRSLLEVAKGVLGQIGEFKPAHEPAGAKTEGGWEFEMVIGTLTKGGKGLMAQAVGLKKGEKEGIIVIVSDSVPTMQKYSDAYNAMVRSMDAPRPAPAPAAGTVDLVYTLPDKWTAAPQAGAIVLTRSNEATRGPSETLRKYQLIVFPSQPLKDGLRKSFLAFWDAQVKEAFETSIMPIPMVRRLKSGTICAFDVDNNAKFKNGGRPKEGWMEVGLYLLAQGDRVVPMVAIFINQILELDDMLLSLMESARIPNAGESRVVPFTAEEIAGVWTESSISIASYVRAGQVVGDASMFTGSDFTLNANGTFKSRFVAVRNGSTLVIQDEGTWTLEDCMLTLQGKAKERYVVHGAGKDAKVGTFLILSTYANNDVQLRMGAPRGYFQSTTFKRKE